MRCDCPVRSAERVRSLYPLRPCLGRRRPRRSEENAMTYTIPSHVRRLYILRALYDCRYDFGGMSCLLIILFCLSCALVSLAFIHVSKIHVALPLLPGSLSVPRCFYKILRSLPHPVSEDEFACYVWSMLFAL